MLLSVVLVALSFVCSRTEATTPPLGTEENCRCSDIVDLVSSAIVRIDKLTVKLENITGLVTSGIPDQLKKQATDIQAIKISVGNFSCDANFRNIESSVDDVANRTQMISESLRAHNDRLQIHDERFQNFTRKKKSVFLASDCSDVRRMGHESSGVYRIKANLTNKEVEVSVYCDFNTPGVDWLVFQRRKDGSVDFYRNWKNYSDGFGDPNGEYWLGNEILSQITSNRKYKLRIDLEDFDNQTSFAEYSSFSIGPLSDYYRLAIGTYSGTAGDALWYHNNMQFSTPDVDRDQWPSNCAVSNNEGSWWYNACHHSNLNGRYRRVAHSSNHEGVEWVTWRGNFYSLKATEMKIARLQ